MPLFGNISSRPLRHCLPFPATETARERAPLNRGKISEGDCYYYGTSENSFSRRNLRQSSFNRLTGDVYGTLNNQRTNPKRPTTFLVLGSGKNEKCFAKYNYAHRATAGCVSQNYVQAMFPAPVE